MTIINAIKKLEKNGFVIKEWENNKGIMSARKEGYKHYIDIFRNGGEYSNDIAVIDVRSPDMLDDPMTDYHAGTFCENITQAIRFVNDWK